MINVEKIKVHAGPILPCWRVTGNKEFRPNINKHISILLTSSLQCGLIALSKTIQGRRKQSSCSSFGHTTFFQGKNKFHVYK